MDANDVNTKESVGVSWTPDAPHIAAAHPGSHPHPHPHSLQHKHPLAFDLRFAHLRPASPDSMTSSTQRRYRGHRAQSFVPIDINELVELRARQRTFEGAYARTALGNMGYALTVLKLFDRRFYRIGLLYAVLAGMLFIISFLRSSHSRHDFADGNRDASYPSIKTVGQTGKRIFGRPFVTAGWIVVAVSAVVATVEIGLLVLVLKL